MTRNSLLGGLAAGLMLSTSVLAQEVDVLHYWTSGSEAAALAKIADAFKVKGGTWVDSGVAGFDAERSIAMTRFAGGNPPEAMLTEIGAETASMAREGLLRNLTDLAEAGKWEEVLPATVADALKVDGSIYAVPIDLGGRNWMYSSAKIFNDIGATPPTTWDEFFAVADKVKAAGYIPLALGGESWQEAILFSSVMSGVGGNDFFKAVYENADAEAAGGPTMVKVFETFRKLNDYVDPGSPGRAWNDTTNLVVTDQAAMIVMGDWAKGEFLGAGKVAGDSFLCDLAPGTTKFYDVIVDAFVFPVVAEDRAAGQTLLIDTMMDPTVQVEFNRLKGSLPPRSDADVSAMDACAVKGAAAMADAGTYVPSISKRPSNDISGQLEDVITSFWNDPTMTPEAAAAAYSDIVASAQ
ncbi:MAG: carbohydrate ABC transporter substrate-binding protein [Cereibacter sphaeroides]|uniref:Probable sugar-binding periplasmic protein n=1 Tax=Cereibacter sphaeroides TaxID=1063 RepID=A0A2W5S6T4_CERSP|nr:MAG: carbohydrate ABC transporter substrate-binding protein [Cereibacter sphaeroides]